MTTGEKLTKLRKENNYTQEQLADLLQVSRQAISRWESDLAFPETEKLIKLSKLYNVTLDYLLKEDLTEKEVKNNYIKNLWNFHFEYKSKKMIKGIPLLHINIGLLKEAKGIIAIGLRARGILSLGILSMGILSIGVLSLGLFTFAALAIGILSIGAIALGFFSIGAIAIGLFSIGALAIGQVSVGACSIGQYFAYGDYARANIAIGATKSIGNYKFMTGDLASKRVELKNIITDNIPTFYQWFCLMFL